MLYVVMLFTIPISLTLFAAIPLEIIYFNANLELFKCWCDWVFTRNLPSSRMNTSGQYKIEGSDV